MSQDRPLVLLSSEKVAAMQRMAEAQGWRVARAWEAAPAELAEARAIIHVGGDVLDKVWLEALPNLRLIACVSVGYDGLDVPWCRARGIEVTHAKGLNADDVADHALGLILAAWRKIVVGERVLREGGWRSDARLRPGPGLKGHVLGVVGLGAIGQAVAARAQAFGLEVIWWGPRPKEAPWPRADDLMDLARRADILVVCAPAEATNRGMISAQVIDAVGPKGLIVNIARGQLVAEDALIAALKAGRLGMAGLDVFEEEPTPLARWAEAPNVVLTPHMAGSTSDSIARMATQAVDNVRLFLAGEPLASPV